MLKSISANNLSDGIVVYFIAPANWTRDISKAKTFASEAELETSFALAKADEKHNLIIDPFSIDVSPADAGGLEAVSPRNAIRAKGPTIDFLPKTAS